MHYDTIRPKPAISFLVKKSHGGKIEEDKRYRLWKQIRGVNGQLQDFHLRMTKIDYKKSKPNEKEPGLNTARDKPLTRLQESFSQMEMEDEMLSNLQLQF